MDKNLSEDFKKAYNTKDVFEFCNIIMPEWRGVVTKILENGTEFNSFEKSDWLPGWSSISLSKRLSKINVIDDMIFKSVVYRFHDIIHNLWIFPNLKISNVEDELLYKKIQMAGEVTTLVITEFFWLCNLFDKIESDKYKQYIEKRNAYKIYGKEIKNISIHEIGDYVSLMVGEGSKKDAFKNTLSEDFADDYYRMLENDRVMIDKNIKIIKKQNWTPANDNFYVPQKFMYDISEKDLVRFMLSEFMDLYENPKHNFNYANRNENLVRRRNMNKFPSGWAS
jgi:hypothetical protein